LATKGTCPEAMIRRTESDAQAASAAAPPSMGDPPEPTGEPRDWQHVAVAAQ